MDSNAPSSQNRTSKKKLLGEFQLRINQYIRERVPESWIQPITELPHGDESIGVIQGAIASNPEHPELSLAWYIEPGRKLDHALFVEVFTDPQEGDNASYARLDLSKKKTTQSDVLYGVFFPPEGHADHELEKLDDVEVALFYTQQLIDVLLKRSWPDKWYHAPSANLIERNRSDSS